MLRCRVFGHRVRFSADARDLRWECERGCGAGGSKRYPSERDAQRYAAALERDRGRLGERAPLFGLFPLRVFNAFRRSQERRARARP